MSAPRIQVKKIYSNFEQEISFQLVCRNRRCSLISSSIFNMMHVSTASRRRSTSPTVESPSWELILSQVRSLIISSRASLPSLATHLREEHHSTSAITCESLYTFILHALYKFHGRTPVKIFIDSVLNTGKNT